MWFWIKKIGISSLLFIPFMGIGQSYTKEVKHHKTDSLHVFFAAPEQLLTKEKVKLKADFTFRLYPKDTSKSVVVFNVTIIEKAPFEYDTLVILNSSMAKVTGTVLFADKAKGKWRKRMSYSIPYSDWQTLFLREDQNEAIGELISKESIVSFSLTKRGNEKLLYVQELIKQNRIF